MYVKISWFSFMGRSCFINSKVEYFDCVDVFKYLNLLGLCNICILENKIEVELFLK